jgi:hypothetical protein
MLELECRDRSARDDFMALPRSYRRTLQTWGTDYRRAQNSNYWLDRLRETMDRHADVPLVVTDVRFDNEWALCEAEGARVLRVHQPDVDRLMREKIARGDKDAAHSSEVEVIERQAEATIENPAGNPELMYRNFRALAKERGWHLPVISSDHPGSGIPDPEEIDQMQVAEKIMVENRAVLRKLAK